MTFPLEIMRSFEATTEQVAGFLAFFGDWTEEQDLDPSVAMPLGLMLDEWLTNVVTHGYDGRGGPVEVLVRCDTPARAEVTIRDRAPPFDPLQLAAPDTTQSLEDREIGGLGVMFIRRMATHLSWTPREGGGNQICIVREGAAP